MGSDRQPPPRGSRRPGPGRGPACPGEAPGTGTAAAQELAAKKAAECEARRPVCTGCGEKFTDERWKAAQATDWGTPKDTHPKRCDRCKHQVQAAARQDQVDDERQEQDQAVPEQKAGTWFSCLRTCPGQASRRLRGQAHGGPGPAPPCGGSPKVARTSADGSR